MKITYIGHSGFSVELEKKVLLFDYYRGELPKASGDKKWYVFVSHGHGDHYNRDVLKLRENGLDVTYIFSRDIMTGKKAQEQGILRMKAHESRRVDDLSVRTLKSNDEGVAYLIRTEGKTIYHAGDLNWWHWEGEPEEDNRFMEVSYKKEISSLEQEHMDVAFLVLDPRQEEQFFWGFDWFMRHTDTRFAVPMHMWEDYGTPGRLLELAVSEPYRDRICPVKESGEVMVMDEGNGEAHE